MDKSGDGGELTIGLSRRSTWLLARLVLGEQHVAGRPVESASPGPRGWTVDPALIGSQFWNQLFSATSQIALAVGLTINGAMACLLGLGIIPSLQLSDEVAAPESSLRPALYLIAAGSWLVGLVAWIQGFSTAIAVLRAVYPRFLM